ncbi:MAG: hypothetical protein KGJ02_03910 [Verrucomicrobiota bacterium]|nr:hypothetical protein [Verrucomicrobiota bacterium]
MGFINRIESIFPSLKSYHPVERLRSALEAVVARIFSAKKEEKFASDQNDELTGVVQPLAFADEVTPEKEAEELLEEAKGVESWIGQIKRLLNEGKSEDASKGLYRAMAYWKKKTTDYSLFMQKWKVLQAQGEKRATFSERTYLILQECKERYDRFLEERHQLALRLPDHFALRVAAENLDKIRSVMESGGI